MTKAKAKAKTAPAARDQAKLVEEATAAMRELVARVPRSYDYAAEPALTFDPLQGRTAGKAGR